MQTINGADKRNAMLRKLPRFLSILSSCVFLLMSHAEASYKQPRFIAQRITPIGTVRTSSKYRPAADSLGEITGSSDTLDTSGEGVNETEYAAELKQSPLTFINEHRVEELRAELRKFKRPVTVLEIVHDEINYSRHLATMPDVELVTVVLALGSSELVMSQVESSGYQNMIVLDPHNMGSQEFHKLSMCEHFDVVIVPDVFKAYSETWMYIMRTLTQLGDITFFECDWIHGNHMAEFKHETPNVIPLLQDRQGILYRLEKKKERLELARWTQASTERTYRIDSDYDKKLLIKAEEEPTKMIPGINLITFIMLRGCFPSDEEVLRQIASLYNMQQHHNDLVLGNMIIQGARIRPIDFADAERNADMDTCIKRAVQLFDGSSERLDDPAAWLRRYRSLFAEDDQSTSR